MLQDRTWLLIGRKMSNEASIEELTELEAILRANPELYFSMQAIEDIWRQIPSHNISELDAAYSQHLSRMKDMGVGVPGTIIARPSRKKYLLLSLTAIAAILIATYIFLPSAKHAKASSSLVANTTTSEISTRYGSKTNIVLPDGTKVWLNAGSKLTYEKSFGESLRRVSLIGEAYFDVTKNAEVPFVIHTRDIAIKVLGTEFNVKSYPEERTTETSLIRGSIEVTLTSNEANRIILKPNEKLVVTQDEPQMRTAPPPAAKAEKARPLFSVGHLNYYSKDSTILETSWVENRLVFEDESFADLSVKLARWYGVSFDFQDKEVAGLRFTGSFRNESLQEALKAMKITADFSYQVTNKTVTITK